MKQTTNALKDCKFGFIKTPTGWRNMGNFNNGTDLEIFRMEYFSHQKATDFAIVPFCWHDSPNVMTDAEIAEHKTWQWSKDSEYAALCAVAKAGDNLSASLQLKDGARTGKTTEDFRRELDEALITLAKVREGKAA